MQKYCSERTWINWKELFFVGTLSLRGTNWVGICWRMWRHALFDPLLSALDPIHYRVSDRLNVEIYAWGYFLLFHVHWWLKELPKRLKVSHAVEIWIVLCNLTKLYLASFCCYSNLHFHPVWIQQVFAHIESFYSNLILFTNSRYELHFIDSLYKLQILSKRLVTMSASLHSQTGSPCLTS